MSDRPSIENTGPRQPEGPHVMDMAGTVVRGRLEVHASHHLTIRNATIQPAGYRDLLRRDVRRLRRRTRAALARATGGV